VAEKSIIIIGAGVAGLTTGIYGQMNGYKTQIFEMHSLPGGLCTAWKRNGYTIDGCLHWLVGTSHDSDYYHMWREVGAFEDNQVLNMEEFLLLEGKNGQKLHLYTDADRLEKHLKEIAPEDSKFIEEFTGAIRQFSKLEMPVDKAFEVCGPVDNMKMLAKMGPFLGEMQKWGKIKAEDFAMHFQNPFLREAFQMIWDPDFSSMILLMTMAWMHQKNAGYIVGGSMQIARSMEKRYLDLGGNITYKSRVIKVLVENNRAVGIKLDDGTEYKADYVISAADGYATIFEMLGGLYIDNTIRGYYEKLPIFQPLVYIGLGVNRSFNDLPQLIAGLETPLDQPITVSGKQHKKLGVHIYNFDPNYAPEGKTVLTVMFDSEFEYWNNLRKDLPAYNAEKDRIAEAVISALDKRFPGLAAQIEMRDVATPVTFRRYTGNWQGSYEGWLVTPENMTMRMKKTLPGLSNFYMVGQWVQPGGGLPSGLMTGCHLIQILCKCDKKKYNAAS
jgi:phytoene dehydrogenase-like protein